MDFFSPFGAGGCGWAADCRRRLLLRHLGAEEAQRLRLRGVEVDARVGQNLRGNALLFAQQAEQQVLGADVAVAQIAGFAHGELEYFLGARRIGEIGSGRGCGLTLLHGLLDLLLNLVEVDAEVLEDGGGDTLALADEAEQDVLGAHVFVMEAGSFLARHREDLPHPLSEVVAVHEVPQRGVDVQPTDRPCFLLERFTHIACTRQVRFALGQRSSFRGRDARPARRSGAC